MSGSGRFSTDLHHAVAEACQQDGYGLLSRVAVAVEAVDDGGQSGCWSAPLRQIWRCGTGWGCFGIPCSISKPTWLPTVEMAETNEE